MSTLDAIHRRSIALLAVGAVLTFTLAPARAADSPTLDEIAAKLEKVTPCPCRACLLSCTITRRFRSRRTCF